MNPEARRASTRQHQRLRPNMKPHFFNKAQTSSLIQKFIEHRSSFLYQVNEEKNSLVIFNQSETKIAEFILPLDYSFLINSKGLEDYLRTEQKQQCLYILMQAGSAALAYHDGHKIIHHKIIKKYMVRKGQGKAQITHLNSKGKSRYGSRLRLQESEKFFFEINEKIKDWQILENTDKILFNAPKKLWSLLFEERYEPAFSKDDLRLQSIPYYTDTPNFNEIQKIIKKGQYASLQFYKESKDLKLLI